MSTHAHELLSHHQNPRSFTQVLGGDEAAAKSARHDMRNVQLLGQFGFTSSAPPLTDTAAEAVTKEDESIIGGGAGGSVGAYVKPAPRL
jgi:hypothetical protein